MEYIKLSGDRYLIKDSNGLILNKKELDKFLKGEEIEKQEPIEKGCKGCEKPLTKEVLEKASKKKLEQIIMKKYNIAIQQDLSKEELIEYILVKEDEIKSIKEAK